MNVHPQSFRGLAYEVQNHLYANGATDDSRLTLPIIEQELRHQYGILMKETDEQRQRRGEEPEAYRITPVSLPVPGLSMLRRAELKNVLTFNGKPYITSVRAGVGCDAGEQGFTPCDYRWQLRSTTQLNNRPAYCLEGNTLVVQLTPKTLGVDVLDVSAVLFNPFPDAGRGDAWYWKQPWNVPEDVKGRVKIQAIRVFMGTHIQLQPRQDTKNNGTQEQ